MLLRLLNHSNQLNSERKCAFTIVTVYYQTLRVVECFGLGYFFFFLLHYFESACLNLKVINCGFA